MFFRFFDRTPVSRVRNCYGFTEISEISGRRQVFGLRQIFDHFEHGGPVQTAGTVPGESPHIKANSAVASSAEPKQLGNSSAGLPTFPAAPTLADA